MPPSGEAAPVPPGSALRLTVRFDGPAPDLFTDTFDMASFAERLRGSEGPPRLAVELRDALAREVELSTDRAVGVGDEVFGLHAATGAFRVRRERAEVQVFVLWLGPPHRFWIAWLRPMHRRRRQREADLALAGDLQPVLDRLLAGWPAVRGLAWLTEEEAEAYPL